MLKYAHDVIRIHVYQDIGRKMVAMLNAAGGVMVYGVRYNGVIYGDKINRKEQDNLNNIIDDIVKRIIPTVGLDMYRVAFIPVEETHPNNQVLRISVKPGDPYKLYEDQSHKVSQSTYNYPCLCLFFKPLILLATPLQPKEKSKFPNVWSFVQVYVRRGTSQYGPLTPHQIKDITIKHIDEVCERHF